VPYVHTLRVRFGECDPQGIVFNANYLAYIDVAFTEWWREACGSYAQMAERYRLDVVVAEAVQRFRAPARDDELLDIALSFPDIRTTSFTMAVAMTRAGAAILDAELRYVFVDLSTHEKAPIPLDIRTRLEENGAAIRG
jgi:acyl-CoA thioester hydrolase